MSEEMAASVRSAGPPAGVRFTSIRVAPRDLTASTRRSHRALTSSCPETAAKADMGSMMTT